MVGKKIKILFIGTVLFSKKALKKLIELDANIIGVCTKRSSKFNSDFSDLVPICNQGKIPYKIVRDINSKDNLKWIYNLGPDIIFCFGWSDLIKKELLNLPPMGIIGYHPAKLPQNRGRHPLIWSLALGLEKSASTFFFMNEHADSGDIISQKNFHIFSSDNAQALYTRVVNIALMQIEKILSQLENKKFKRIKQKNSLVNNWRKRSILDGRIDFRMNSEAIYNLVRALSFPYVGAHVKYKNKNVRIWEVSIVKNSYIKKNIESGKILDCIENKILVKTYDGAVEILKHEFTKTPKVGEYL